MAGIKILQGNLQKSWTADNLLSQLAVEMSVQVIFVSEPYRGRSGVQQIWYEDTSGTAALWVVDSPSIPVNASGAGDGFVWIRSANTTFVSCYLSPNGGIQIYRERLEALEDAIRDCPGELVVAGDFNARACEWGMPTTNSRGRLLLEMASRLGLLVMNEGNMPTYQRPGFGESIPDVTLASENLSARIEGWKVLQENHCSDHNYITFQLTRERREKRSNQRPLGWSLAKMDEGKFLAEIRRGREDIPTVHVGPLETDTVERFVTGVSRLIRRACDASMPRKRVRGGRTQVYWWNDQISRLRRDCLKLRRRATRARARELIESLSEKYKAKKKELVRAIKASKAKCFRTICEEVNQDPWGMGYKLVTKRIGTPSASPTDAATLRNIVDVLFPTHPVREDQRHLGPALDVPLFSREELLRAVGSLKNGKVPGPDGVPAEVLKVVVKHYPDILLNMYNVCLANGVFASRWKTARLMLLSKGKGGSGSPSSYRPLCMLNTDGKVMEKLLKPRLLEAVRAAGDLSEHQYGFRAGHSTIGALSEVVHAVKIADQLCHAARPIVLLVTLDVKNAFYSARWDKMLEALEQNFRIPDYLSRILRDYLRDRWLQYETEEGKKNKSVTAGVAQGSILGPDLWNIRYDSLLRLELPSGAQLIGYADDVAVVITARTMEIAQCILDTVMRRVNKWMGDQDHELAIPKTDIVMLTRRRIPTVIPMKVGSEDIQTKSSAKYLGVLLDNKLNFGEHIRKACDRASNMTTSLSRLMRNIGGPRPGKRRLLMSVAQSILLYGAEIWAGSLNMRKYRTRVAAIQRRGALRIACSYRTVSEPAVIVLAGVIPIDLLAKERQNIYRRSAEIGRETAAAEARLSTMEVWQERWDSADARGKWTKRLIRELSPWLKRGHGEIDFYLTQFLTGHGYFREYLYRMGKMTSPRCSLCGAEKDTVEHTFFSCSRFAEERRTLEVLLDGFEPEKVVEKMLRDEDSWNLVSTYVGTVLRLKKQEGCLEDSRHQQV